MTWEEYYQRCVESANSAGPAHFEHLQAARKRVATNDADDWAWLMASLDDDERKWFVAAIFAHQQMPRRLFGPMIRAGVLEPDASRNRVFIRPCVRSFGVQETRDAIQRFTNSPSRAERAGAAKALYWAVEEST